MRQQALVTRQELLFGSGLAMVMGALDAYAYLEHGAVFAGFQAGNLLLGTHMGHGELAEMGRYLAAILAFILGIGLVRLLEHALRKRQNWPTVALWVEFSLLIVVLATNSVVPHWVAAALLALTAAVELQTFRQTSAAGTPQLLTGDLRTSVVTLLDGVWRADRAARQRALIVLASGGSFLLGAVLVSTLSLFLGSATVLLPILLVVGLIFERSPRSGKRQRKH